MYRITFCLAFICCLFFCTNCTQNNPVAPIQVPEQGKIAFSLSASDNIATGTVTITKGALTGALPVVVTQNTGTVVFENIQVGTWTVMVQLFDDAGVEIYSGTGTASVTKGQTTTLSVYVDMNTGHLVIKVKLPETSSAPRCSFLLDEDGTTSLYTIHTDGVDLRKIFEMPSQFNRYTGHTVIFEQSPIGDNYIFGTYYNIELWRMDSHGGNPTLVHDGFSLFKARWSADGSRIALLTHGSVRVMDADGSNERILKKYDFMQPPFYPGNPSYTHYLRGLAWTRDNCVLYGYTFYMNPVSAPAYEYSAINKIPAAGGTITEFLGRRSETHLGAYYMTVMDCSQLNQILYKYETKSQSSIFDMDQSSTLGSFDGNDCRYSSDGENCLFIDNQVFWIADRYGKNAVQIPNVPSGAYCPNFFYE